LKFLGLRPTLREGGVRRVVATLEHEVPETDEERLTLVMLRENIATKTQKEGSRTAAPGSRAPQDQSS
jgi:hypothetical protein